MRDAPLFEAQAAFFEARAGLPAAARASIAAALFELGPFDSTRRILDIGAGGGDIGLELSAAGDAYLGIDESPAMLTIFRNRATFAGLRPELAVADASEPWPVPPGSVGLVFGSRSLHFVDPRHAATQAFAAASPRGAALVIGRVQREHDGVAATVRRAMRALLRREGYEGRSPRDHAARLLAECTARGASPFASRTVASWTVHRSIRDSIDAWRSKPGLAGVDVPKDVKARLLDELERFTSETPGNIDAKVESREHYVLEGAILVHAPVK